MDKSQGFEIQNTQNVNFSISTTAITESELSLIDLPQGITISPTLTPKTRFLITYKAVFTEKYIQALIWNIPILNPEFLFNITANFKNYEMKPFQGAVFTTSGVSDEIFNNYFVLLGAIYEPNCSIFIDFLICDNEDSEKYKFCIKYEIPVIKTSQVFSNNYSLFKKKTKYDAMQIQPKTMFFGKIFFLDSKLPKPLFNKLRRIIIENEGTRVSTINEETNFVITLNYNDYKAYSSKLLHYQYIFDCSTCNSLLYPEFYKFNFSYSNSILLNTLIAVDKSMVNANEYINKLISLGSTVKNQLDLRCTHYITTDPSINRLKSLLLSNINQQDKKKSEEQNFPFLILSPEWIDQCLSLLKHVKEGRFGANRPTLNLKRRLSLKKQEEPVFQFTGLPPLFKDEAIKKLKDFGIKFIDSDKFDKSCTHLIMGTINSSEKFFCSLVNGCWILKPNFIDDFENQANFEYESYEWVSMDDMTPKEKKAIESIKKWRIKIQESKRKAFYKWNVKIYCTEAKMENYKNLILAGDGTMDDTKPYTHVFVDKSYKEKVNNEKAVSTDSIFSYLFK